MSSVTLPRTARRPLLRSQMRGRKRGSSVTGRLRHDAPRRHASGTRNRIPHGRPPTPILRRILQEVQTFGWVIRNRHWERQHSGLPVSTGAADIGTRHPGRLPPAQGRRTRNLSSSRTAPSTAYTQDVRDYQCARAGSSSSKPGRSEQRDPSVQGLPQSCHLVALPKPSQGARLRRSQQYPRAPTVGAR